MEDNNLRERIGDMAWHVTQNGGTERAFSGDLVDNHIKGTYHCIVCDEPLFSGDYKFDSKSGWPSFTKPLAPQCISTKNDYKLLVRRTEVNCSNCNAHLGHVFKDGPAPTGLRYCINSVALRFEPQEKA